MISVDQKLEKLSLLKPLTETKVRRLAKQEYMTALAESRKNSKVEIFEEFITEYVLDKLS